MKERYAATKLIVGGEFHMLTRQETVVGDVVVSQHDPFREAGRTGSYCILTTSWQFTLALAASKVSS